MAKLHHITIALVLGAASTTVVAQDTPAFEVVSIKRVDELRNGGGMRTLPDGTFMMMNQPMGTLVNVASPVFVFPQDIVGMPDWMKRERYDVTVKPPAGLTREQLREHVHVMWQGMFADRMKLVAHIEQRERDAYTLVTVAGDGKLGPHLKPSTLDCSPRPAGSAPPPSPELPSLQERQNRCGLSMSGNLIVSGGITMDRFVRSLGGLAGGQVQDGTGLVGQYALTLRFSTSTRAGAPASDAVVDDAPDFFTALREQLGLKLEREKKAMPVFVIDHIERPSDN